MPNNAPSLSSASHWDAAGKQRPPSACHAQSTRKQRQQHGIHHTLSLRTSKRTGADDARVAARPVRVSLRQLSEQLVPLHLTIDQICRLPPRSQVALPTKWGRVAAGMGCGR